jgi:anti-anti-sigma regulatory factor
MDFCLIDHFGSVPTGRAAASRFRESVQAAIRGGQTVTIDLAGIQTMSPSFAHELFGKLPTTANVRFLNVPSSVEPLIKIVRQDEARSPTQA